MNFHRLKNNLIDLHFMKIKKNKFNKETKNIKNGLKLKINLFLKVSKKQKVIWDLD